MDVLLKKLRSFFHHLAEGASEVELGQFEKQLPIRLPLALRRLYLDHNGEPEEARLEYRLLPLHECRLLANHEGCRFWVHSLVVEEHGAVYQFSDGSVRTGVKDHPYPSVEAFLEHLLENPLGDSACQDPPPLPPAVQALLESAEELDCPERAAQILKTLELVPNECAEHLQQYLEDDDENVCVATCAWMAQAGFRQAECILASLARFGSDRVTQASLSALVRLGSLSELIAMAGVTMAPRRDKVIEALVEMGCQVLASEGGLQLMRPGTCVAEWLNSEFGNDNPYCSLCGKDVVQAATLEEPGCDAICPECGPVRKLPCREIAWQVRRRPAMYFGSLEEAGTHQLAIEIVANAVDQFLMGHATRIAVLQDEWSLEVQDDGEGFPLESERGEEFLTQFHNTPTGDDHAPHIHLVTAGVGLAPINAVCSKFQVESARGQSAFRICYACGTLQKKEEDATLDFCRGTRVRVQLDRELWQAGFEKNPLRRRLFDLAHLVPRLPIALNREVFYSENGLLDLADFEQMEIGARRFGYQGQSEFLIVNAAFTGQSGQNPRVRSWVNGAVTEEHGSHVEGALAALKKANWQPATLLIHVILREPRYAGPVRRRLVVDKVKREVRAMLRQPLEDYLGNLLSQDLG